MDSLEQRFVKGFILFGNRLAGGQALQPATDAWVESTRWIVKAATRSALEGPPPAIDPLQHRLGDRQALVGQF